MLIETGDSATKAASEASSSVGSSSKPSMLMPGLTQLTGLLGSGETQHGVESWFTPLT